MWAIFLLCVGLRRNRGRCRVLSPHHASGLSPGRLQRFKKQSPGARSFQGEFRRDKRGPRLCRGSILKARSVSRWGSEAQSAGHPADEDRERAALSMTTARQSWHGQRAHRVGERANKASMRLKIFSLSALQTATASLFCRRSPREETL